MQVVSKSKKLESTISVFLVIALVVGILGIFVILLDSSSGGGSNVPNYNSGNSSDESSERPEYEFWLRVESLDELREGDKIVITDNKSSVALSTAQESSFRSSTPVYHYPEGQISFGEAVQVITLEKGYTDGTFSLNVGNNGAKEYLSSSDSYNGLITKNAIDAFSSWVITYDSFGNPHITSQGSTQYKYFDYVVTHFSCVSDLSTSIRIYKLYTAVVEV